MLLFALRELVVLEGENGGQLLQNTTLNCMLCTQMPLKVVTVLGGVQLKRYANLGGIEIGPALASQRLLLLPPLMI